MEFHLAADAMAPLLARHRVTTAANCAGTPTAEALALLTSELVSNAIRHAPVPPTQDVVVRFRDGDSLRVEVLDGGAGFVAPAERPPGQPGGGWGLHIVDQLAAAWGVEAEGTWNKVWFELDR
jgi:anti-sigma regulatory factor (Ser/Thr protein kinase)